MIVVLTVIGSMIVLLLPAIITGDWFRDRCDAIERGELRDL